MDRLRFAIRDPKARADVEDNFRKTIGQLLGGAAVLIGAGFAYLQFIQQQRAAHDLLISNQVAKGFELLGNKDNQIQQRLGGIYALEGVMNTSEEYHKPVLEALNAFVRDGTRTETGDGPPAIDIQAALTVIGRRAAIGTGIPNLANAHIPQAGLRFANLVDANLVGADLHGADLTGAFLSAADLSGANLVRADLSGAFLKGANLRGAFLLGANLTGAFVGRGPVYGGRLVGAGLPGANLVGANLHGANLSHANLVGAKGLTQEQLDQACGTDVELDPGLTIKPCQK